MRHGYSPIRTDTQPRLSAINGSAPTLVRASLMSSLIISASRPESGLWWFTGMEVLYELNSPSLLVPHEPHEKLARVEAGGEGQKLMNNLAWSDLPCALQDSATIWHIFTNCISDIITREKAILFHFWSYIGMTEYRVTEVMCTRCPFSPRFLASLRLGWDRE